MQACVKRATQTTLTTFVKGEKKQQFKEGINEIPQEV